MPRSVCVLFLLTISAVACVGCRRSASRLEAELQVADRARGEALRTSDTAALARVYADEFVMVTSTGQLRTKADQLRDIGTGTVQHQGMPERILDLRLYGNVAVVHGESAPGTLVMGGQPDPRGRRYTRVYIHRRGRWQLLATHISVVADSMARQ